VNGSQRTDLYVMRFQTFVSQKETLKASDSKEKRTEPPKLKHFWQSSDGI